MNQELLSQALADFENEMGLPPCAHEMQPWDVVAAMRDRLPPCEQKTAELFIKLGEVQEILNELQCTEGSPPQTFV